MVLLFLAPLTTAAQESLPAADTLSAGWNTLVPGGAATCARNTPYQFFVRPGDPQRLTIYFQHGGACWNALTCLAGQPFYDPAVGSAEDEIEDAGIFDAANADNPLADDTMLFIPYCSGDVHSGNAAVRYGDFTVAHRGNLNATAALDWVYANYAKPETVRVLGSSAGGYGSLFHLPAIVAQYPEARIVQVSDAATGILPEGWTVLESWGSYDNLPTQLEAVRARDPRTFTLLTYYEALLTAYPDVQFAQYSAAFDRGQITFHDLIGLPGDWSDAMAAQQAALADYANFHTFVAGGAEHMILTRDDFYTYAVEGVRFRDWFAALVDGAPVSSVQCTACDTAERGR